MKTLTLVVDERELSTIRAALLLLQEQVNALPEDLADMMNEHGPAMTEKEVGRLTHRLDTVRESTSNRGRGHSSGLTLMKAERTAEAAFSPD
jgi:hypothetical protein